MPFGPRPSLLLLVPFLLVVIGATAGVWRYGYLQALDQLARRGQSDLALVLDGLASDLQRYRDQAVLLADHPMLTALSSSNTPADGANRLLLAAADRTAATALYYVDADGRILARSQRLAPRDLRQAAYFRRAMDGALGTAHGIDRAFGSRMFYFAAPAFGPDGQVQGALVTLADVENIEFGWRGDGTAMLLIDRGNRIFMSNRSEFLGWQHSTDTDPMTTASWNAGDFGQHAVGPYQILQLDLGPYLPARALHLTRSSLRIGMSGVALVDIAPARKIATLQAGVTGTVLLFFGSLLFLARVRRATLARANAQLEYRVAKRTADLTRSNSALRHEIHERREAEAALKKAQADLVQAGKLSALGQMSAGISHELNQPLMAIQQFADNGAAFLARGKPAAAGENLSRISQLAARAARIIRNLRAFSRNESEPMGKVDLVQVLNTAVELSEARLKRDGITLVWAPEACGGPVYALGGEVRLGQVFVNLINNAADAMAGQTRKEIHIHIDTGARLTVTVRDTGPGIADPDRIFEPFYSTKAIGTNDGIGLGLSISYGLIQSFGGNIRGSNAPGQGAVFTVELDHWRQAEAAA